MKIAHGLLSHEFAGAERHLAELAGLQLGQGHEVHLLLETLKPEIEARWRAEAPGAVFHFLPTRWPAAFSGLWAWRTLGQIKPDLYHAHLGRAARRLGWGARWLKIPFVATLHLNYRKKEHAKADGLILIADWQKRDMPGYAKPAVTIWNWVRPNAPASADDAVRRAEQLRNLRAAWQAGPATKVFLSAGRLVRQKGMDVLIQAFQKAFPTGKEDARLVILGEGPMRADLAALAKGDARILLAGYIDDPATHFTAADVFVSAARYEPFGLVLLEAMAAGLPIISTQTDGPSEFLKGSKNVHWARPDDVKSLAAVLQKVLAGKSAGRVSYDMKPFRPEAALARVMDFYKKFL
jgi:glycosyltransferase involved in cell wall biosynthesis